MTVICLKYRARSILTRPSIGLVSSLRVRSISIENCQNFPEKNRFGFLSVNCFCISDATTMVPETSSGFNPFPVVISWGVMMSGTYTLGLIFAGKARNLSLKWSHIISSIGVGSKYCPQE
jgi:hypothetical protein